MYYNSAKTTNLCAGKPKWTAINSCFGSILVGQFGGWDYCRHIPKFMPLWWGIPLVDFAGLPGRHFFSNRWNYEKVVGALLRFFRSVPGSWTCTTPFFPIKNLRFFHHDSLPKKEGSQHFHVKVYRDPEITNSNTAMFKWQENPSQISINICIKFDSPPKRKWVLQWPHHTNHHGKITAMLWYSLLFIHLPPPHDSNR